MIIFPNGYSYFIDSKKKLKVEKINKLNLSIDNEHAHKRSNQHDNNELNNNSFEKLLEDEINLNKKK